MGESEAIRAAENLLYGTFRRPIQTDSEIPEMFHESLSSAPVFRDCFAHARDAFVFPLRYSRNMANQRSSPSDPGSKDTFLGGGLQFNKVGTSIPGASSLPPEEAPVVVASPAQARSRLMRTLVIVAALALLVTLLFVFSSDTFSGVRHTQGHGGISPSSHTPTPPRNF